MNFSKESSQNEIDVTLHKLTILCNSVGYVVVTRKQKEHLNFRHLFSVECVINEFSSNQNGHTDKTLVRDFQVTFFPSSNRKRS